jgi:hypothetical protein
VFICHVSSRLYGEGHESSWTLLKDVLVSAMMSDKRLGPKIYGVFKCGRLEELINVIEFHE